jgi:hypothetical protein
MNSMVLRFYWAVMVAYTLLVNQTDVPELLYLRWSWSIAVQRDDLFDLQPVGHNSNWVS